jgi:hypothetical protein
VFASAGFCEDFQVGGTYRYALSLSQSGEQMTAIIDYGAPWLFPSVAAPIREDGASVFAASMNAVEPELGITLSLEPAFTINSTRTGELTGTVNEVWRLPNFPGEGRLTQEIVSTIRSSTAAPSSISEGDARRLRFPRKLTMQKR